MLPSAKFFPDMGDEAERGRLAGENRLFRCLISIFLFLIIGASAANGVGLHGPNSPGFNQPDSPGTISFDKIKLREVKAPSLKVPATCDPTYRAGMESSFRKIWAQCQELGKNEPSDCQRGLFDRCTRVAQELQKMEVSTCIEMDGEKEALDRILKPDNQKNSQVSASDLNRRAAVASRKVADALGKNAAELAKQRMAATMALKLNACAFSSAAKEYRQTETKLINELTANEKFVKTQAEAKKAAADQFNRNSGQSASSASQLKSAVAVNPSNQASTISGTLSTYTVTETQPVAALTTATIVTTSTVLTTTVTPQTVVVPKPTPLPPYPDIYSSNKREIPTWVPILAVAVPAAILGGIVISKMRKGDGVSSPSSDPGPGSSSPDPGTSSPEPVSQGPSPPPNPIADPSPGAGDLRSLEMRLDSSFTDREKGTIAEAVQRIPSCLRYKLKGIEVVRSDLSSRTAERGKCVAGTFVLGGNTVRLDGSGCVGVQVGVTVHEFFHVIGNRNGDAVHARYLSQVYNAHPQCPVSPYGAKNFFEDFAEAGRILTVPSRQPRQRNYGSCVEAKLSGLRQILSCQ